jgi:cyanate permease
MDPALRLKSRKGRWVLLATVLGSGVAFLDATVVNVALPTIGEELHATVAELQWVVNAYTLTLAGLILLGGSLGDRYGRRRVFVLGVIWFAVASALCAAAVNVQMLIAARALEGIGGALLTRLAGDHPDLIRARGPAEGGGRLVRAGRHRGRDRPVPRRLAGERGGLALGVPDQPAAGGDRGGGGCPARPGDQG